MVPVLRIRMLMVPVLRIRVLMVPVTGQALAQLNAAFDGSGVKFAVTEAARNGYTFRPISHRHRQGYTSSGSVRVSGLCEFMPAHPTRSPLSASCSSRPRLASGALQASSRPGRPCRAADGYPCRVRGGLSSPGKGLPAG